MTWQVIARGQHLEYLGLGNTVETKSVPELPSRVRGEGQEEGASALAEEGSQMYHKITL